MVEKIVLNDNTKIPRVGFGTYKASAQVGADAVVNALNAGYRLIDTAAKYENEEAVGAGIKASAVAREELIVTTKCWRENLGYQQTKLAFEESLKNLDLDYIDLYLIHWPANAINYANWQETNADTWRAMEELQAEGKVKSIGLSNFWQEHLEALFNTAKVLPSVNQIEFHPGYWQPELVAFCKNHGIVVEGWSPLARGKIFENEILNSIAKKYGKTVAQISLRWIIQHEVIPIPKSVTPVRMEENIQLFDFVLTDEEMRQIDALPKMGFSGELPNKWPEKL